jgi:DNA invertase Pin-like site-specific DNA recombinase
LSITDLQELTVCALDSVKRWRHAEPAIPLVVTKLDRLARSLSDARDIANELTAKGVVLSLGGNSHDPTDPVGRLLFNILGMVAEFEVDLIRARTREGIAVAKAKGRLKAKQPNCPRRNGSTS